MNPVGLQKGQRDLQFGSRNRAGGAACCFWMKAAVARMELRIEVERLLASYDSEFMEQPAVAEVAELVVPGELGNGRQLGRYTVLRSIGKGGMGEVYLAEDSRLSRQVALKVLPEEFAADTDRLSRFEQEAKAASALNHPNILTIFEFAEEEGSHFIVSEYVDGQTLRRKIRGGGLPVSESLDIAMQAAAALDAADNNGIIHRDIKPENIMVRDDGLVKVLDFGLAKLIEKKNIEVSEDASTEKHFRTAPGMIMGTVEYMSPEQTRGQPTDARTDIWSLGCVIYEMLAGRSPFTADNTADLIAEIVKARPAPLSNFDGEIPERLQEIISKSLEKDPGERYQTVKDLLLDLKRLKRRFDAEDTLEPSNSNLTNDPDEQLLTAPNIISTRKGPRDLTTASSAEYLIWGIKAHRLTAVGITLFVLSLLGGTALLVRQYWRLPVKVPMPFATNNFSRITNNGKSSYPAISPNGRHVAYAVFSNGLTRVVVRQVTSDSELEVMPPTKIDSFYGIRFSNDGDFIYFVPVEEGLGNLYRVPALGGTRKKLLEDIDSNVSFGPDGSEFVFIRNSTESKSSSVVVASDTGGEERTIVKKEGYGAFHSVAWSPDRDLIIVALAEESSTSYGEAKTRFATISVSSGQTTIVNEKVWTGATHINWLKDGSGIVFVARNDRTRWASVWHMAYPQGEVTQLTNHPDNYPAISGIAGGQTLTVERAIEEASLWSLNLRSKKTEQLRVESPEQLGRNGIVDLDKGNLLVTKFEPESSNFWLIGKNLKSESKLTDEQSQNYHPSLSYDGRHIVFISTRTGRPRLWRSDVDGKNPVQLSRSDGGTETYPRILPDNKTVLFVRDVIGAWQTVLMKTSLDGSGEEIVVSEDKTAIGMPSISLDGKLLAYWSLSYAESGQPRSLLKISGIDGGTFTSTAIQVSFPEFGHPLFPCAWTDNNKLVCVGNKDPSNLYSLTLNGRVQKLTDFKDGTIYHPTLLNNRKELWFNRHFSKSDIYLIKDRL